MCIEKYTEKLNNTVNFKGTTKYFKDKSKIYFPKEQWKIFKNTHEPIIDAETWNTVQHIREVIQKTDIFIDAQNIKILLF